MTSRLPSSALIAALALVRLSRVALAHEGERPTPDDLWLAWSWDPVVLLAGALTTWGYTRGIRELWRRAGTGRGLRQWQVMSFALGLVALFVALVSPLDALATALFSAHMVQHLLLVVVVAPLLVLGEPLMPVLWALPPAWRRKLGAWWKRTPLRRAWNRLTQPALVWALHTIAMWVWHLPGLYQAALQFDAIHVVEHTSFLGTALLYWWTLARSRAHGRMSYGVAMISVFAMTVQSSVLGALITFAPAPWYPIYATSTAAWGITPLQDQQLAGLIMWVPAGLIYTMAAFVILGRWLREADRPERPHQRQSN